MTDTKPSPPPDAAPPPDKANSGFLRRLLVFLLLSFLAGGGYLAYDAWHFLHTPPETASPRDVIVDIPQGVTFDRVAWMLYKAKIITDVPRFRLLAQYHKKLGSIQAGEFSFNTGWTPDRVLRHLISGRSLLYRLALREGLPYWEVARLVEEGGFARAADFEAVIRDPAFLREYGIPFSTAEGFLYPETYMLRKPRGTPDKEQAQVVARILVEMFWKRNWALLEKYAASASQPQGSPLFLPNSLVKTAAPAHAKTAADSARNATAAQNATTAGSGVGGGIATLRTQAAAPLPAPVSAETLRRLVILASLVEKETGVPQERDRVAGVYANRLRLNMLLQCDPTIIYGLGKNQSGPIRRSQLNDAKNLYNTYQHPGLPPGPICSPGFASMQAAAEPEQHNYLYFVATGHNGTHKFSTNLNDHNQAVIQYRATQR